MISGILWWEPNITFWYGGRIFKPRYSNLTKCQNSGEEEAGDSEVPRPTQSNTDGNDCCVIYQELPALDNVKQTVTAEINIGSSTGNMFCYLDIPCLMPVSHAAPGLASPDAMCGDPGGSREGERPDGEPGGPNADISPCQVPTPKRSSSIVKRLQSAISGNVYIWQMVQHGFRANWPLPQVSQHELFIPGKHEIVLWHTNTNSAQVGPQCSPLTRRTRAPLLWPAQWDRGQPGQALGVAVAVRMGGAAWPRPPCLCPVSITAMRPSTCQTLASGWVSLTDQLLSPRLMTVLVSALCDFNNLDEIS